MVIPITSPNIDYFEVLKSTDFYSDKELYKFVRGREHYNTKLKNKQLSKFERIRLTKPMRVIDACVFLETIEEKEPVCTRYLSKAGFDYRAYITIPLLGEIFLGASRITDGLLREKVFKFIFELLEKKKIEIIPISKNRDQYILELLTFASIIPIDDLSHISNLLDSGFNEFVTLDQKIHNEKIKQVLSERYKLKIIHPKEI